ncbi:hypothetical protein [Streptomyces sp. NPDC048644]|uniref:hypothetical protein n=1 Tax=Streptomyces sp. NPDC048644 TaxID=3365582 RepID=UPI003712B2F7
MTTTTLHRTTTETPNSASAPQDSAIRPDATRPDATRPASRAHADSMAVASFVLGLLGTLVFNVVLGPCALVLGALALARRTTRRGRALLGLALGAADLVILAVLVTTDGTVSWHLTG